MYCIEEKKVLNYLKCVYFSIEKKKKIQELLIE